LPVNSPLPSLVYLVYREALSSVFASQVLTPLEEHRGLARVTLGLHAPVGHLLRAAHKPAVKKIAERCSRSRIDLGWLPSPPTRVPWLWSDRLLLRQWLAKKFPGDEPFIVRCRGSKMTCLSLDAVRGWPHAKVIYDCRGAEAFETIQSAGLADTPEPQWPTSQRQQIERVMREERRAVEETAGVTCVSHAMVDSLRSRYPQTPAAKFFVVPCCPNVNAFGNQIPHRDEVRQTLGLTGKFVVTYLGSLVWYQMPEESLRIFRLIREIKPDAHFLAITTDPAKMQALVEKSGIPASDTTIRSFPPQEVPRWLVASDLALMLRDTTETNRVASPVKFGEYLAAGIPVIVSQHLGDCTGIVEQQRLGVSVDLSQTDAQLRETLAASLAQLPPDLSMRCHEYATRELSWSRFVPPLVEWYESLTS
jgi:glycosyltransferase involved in cell wall biosynthesis